MAETAGYPTTIKRGGAAVAITNEPCTRITPNTVYRITDAAKRVLDPAVAITVEVDAAGSGSWAAGTGYTVDPYTGTVTFGSDQGGSAVVRVSSASYVPLLTVARARAASIKRARTILDASVFNPAGFKSFLYGLLEVTGSLEVLDAGTDDLDSGAGTAKFIDEIEDGTQFLLEIDMGAQGVKSRLWASLESLDPSSTVDGLVSTQLAFKASGRGTAPVISTT